MARRRQSSRGHGTAPRTRSPLVGNCAPRSASTVPRSCRSIAEREVRLRPETLAIADDASKELTRFDAEAGSFAAPFAAILLRTESASSSEVEQLTASAKQVALAELDRSDSPNAQLVVANVRAMKAAIGLADRLDEQAIIAMHEALLEASAPHFVGPLARSAGMDRWRGRSRRTTRCSCRRTTTACRSSWPTSFRFAGRTDVPALAHAAIAHAQFETNPPVPRRQRAHRAGVAARHAPRGRRHAERGRAGFRGLLGDLDAYFRALTAVPAGAARRDRRDGRRGRVPRRGQRPVPWCASCRRSRLRGMRSCERDRMPRCTG